MILHPSYSPALACESLSCQWRHYAIASCVKQFCPYRWQRIGAQDKASRQEADQREAEAKE